MAGKIRVVVRQAGVRRPTHRAVVVLRTGPRRAKTTLTVPRAALSKPGHYRLKVSSLGSPSLKRSAATKRKRVRR